MTTTHKLLATIAVLCAFAAASGPVYKSFAAKRTRNDARQEAGRYQIVMRKDIRADTYLLDTATGRVWQHVQFVQLEGGPVAWRFMPRLDSSEAMFKWAATQTDKK